MSSTSTRSTSTRTSKNTTGANTSGQLLPLPAAARDGGLLIARVLLGVILIAHGWQKFSTWGLDGTAANFEEMGIPAPTAAAAVAATIELVGGILLVVGLLTPLVAVAVPVVMAGAFWFVHRELGIFATDGGWELVAVIGLAAAVFGLVGPGRFSLDALLGGRRARHAD